jgi:hypothetical protein
VLGDGAFEFLAGPGLDQDPLDGAVELALPLEFPLALAALGDVPDRDESRFGALVADAAAGELTVPERPVRRDDPGVV